MRPDSDLDLQDQEPLEDARSEGGYGGNERFLEALTHFTDWIKHIITISSGVLVLSAAFLKDIVVTSDDLFRMLAGLLLTLTYAGLLLAVWRALRFISYASGTVLAEGPIIASGEDLERLQSLLRQTQRLFFAGLAAFAALAMVSLAAWVIDPTAAAP